MKLHLVRHGESLANEADRAVRPRPDDWDALSERGWEQARGLGRRLDGEGIQHIVAARQDNMLVISFHPEIAGETRLHELFLQDVAA